jgi:hypothetical protein
MFILFIFKLFFFNTIECSLSKHPILHQLPPEIIHLFSTYTSYHTQSRTNESGEKYLIYRDIGCEDIVGIGNRINGFVSSLLLAILTNRIFLIDSR